MANEHDLVALPHAGGRIAVFAGSEMGRLPAYRQAAQELGRLLAAEGLDLIFGGTSGGLMQAVADAVKAGGGKVIGVLPEGAWPELYYPCTERWEVENLAARKLLMITRADAVIVLPGGLGTLDELLEVMMLVHLEQERKIIGVLNTMAFYLPLLGLLDYLTREGMVRVDPRRLLLVDRDPASLLQRVLTDHRWLFSSSLALERRRRES